MKNILVILLSLVIFGSSSSFAQSSNVKQAKKSDLQKPGKEQTAVQTEQPKKAKLKADGTPDMRYKENKPKMKKDGTPDMRYKANKEAAKKK